MKTITRNKRPDELPFTALLCHAHKSETPIKGDFSTQLEIDQWVKQGAFLRTTPDDRIELTIQEELFDDHEQSIVDTWRAKKMVQYWTGENWDDSSPLLPFDMSDADWKIQFDQFKYRIKPVFTEHEQSIIDAWQSGKTVQFRDNRGNGAWCTTLSRSETGQAPMDWSKQFRHFEYRIKPEEWVPPQGRRIEHAIRLTLLRGKAVLDKMETTESPGEGWRLLEAGEKIEEGDQWKTQTGTWEPVRVTWGTVSPSDTCRRRIKPALRLMRPDEFPEVWWFKFNDFWFLVVAVYKEEFYIHDDRSFDLSKRSINDVWSPDRKVEKSFFVEDVK